VQIETLTFNLHEKLIFTTFVLVNKLEHHVSS
jgi:hypothetical protein